VCEREKEKREREREEKDKERKIWRWCVIEGKSDRNCEKGGA
jgi:hypothetical protein